MKAKKVKGQHKMARVLELTKKIVCCTINIITSIIFCTADLIVIIIKFLFKCLTKLVNGIKLLLLIIKYYLTLAWIFLYVRNLLPPDSLNFPEDITSFASSLFHIFKLEPTINDNSSSDYETKTRYRKIYYLRYVAIYINESKFYRLIRIIPAEIRILISVIIITIDTILHLSVSVISIGLIVLGASNLLFYTSEKLYQISVGLFLPIFSETLRLVSLKDIITLNIKIIYLASKNELKRDMRILGLFKYEKGKTKTEWPLDSIARKISVFMIDKLLRQNKDSKIIYETEKE